MLLHESLEILMLHQCVQSLAAVVPKNDNKFQTYIINWFWFLHDDLFSDLISKVKEKNSKISSICDLSICNTVQEKCSG